MYEEIESDKGGRRQFFMAVGRYLALAGLAGYAVFQFIKGRRLKNDPNCIRLYTCDQCVEFAAGCQLPKAEDFREQHPGGTG